MYKKCVGRSEKTKRQNQTWFENLVRKHMNKGSCSNQEAIFFAFKNYLLKILKKEVEV